MAEVQPNLASAVVPCPFWKATGDWPSGAADQCPIASCGKLREFRARLVSSTIFSCLTCLTLGTVRNSAHIGFGVSLRLFWGCFLVLVWLFLLRCFCFGFAPLTNMQSLHTSYDDLCTPRTWRPYSRKKKGPATDTSVPLYSSTDWLDSPQAATPASVLDEYKEYRPAKQMRRSFTLSHPVRGCMFQELTNSRHTCKASIDAQHPVAGSL